MFTNRITRYLLQQSTRASSIASPTATLPSAPSVVPMGFVPLPIGMLSGIPQGDIYRMAYEAAQTAARQKLLEMLRARAGWN